MGMLAALLTLLVPERLSTRLNGDSIAYVGAARSLVQDGRLVAPFAPYDAERAERPLAHYPPGYPIALALPIALGASADVAIDVVRAASAFVAVGLLVLLVAQLGGSGAAVLAGALALVTPSVVWVYHSALSESLFVALTVALIWLMTLHRGRSLTIGMTAAALVMVRYVGVAFAGVAVAWGFFRPGTLTDRLRRALVMGLPTLVTLVGWKLWTAEEGGTVRRFGVQAPVGETLRGLAGGVSRWLAPGAPDAALTAFAKLAALVLFVLLVTSAIGLLLRDWRLRRDERAEAGLVFVGLVAASATAYWTLYALARVFADHALDFAVRYWAPLEILFAGVLALAVGVCWRERPGVVRWLGAGAVAAWGVAAATATVLLISDARAENARLRSGVGSSTLVAWVRAQPPDQAFFTNWSAALFVFTGRASRELPTLADSAVLRALAARLRDSRGVVVTFANRNSRHMLRPFELELYVPPDSLAARLGLETLVRDASGAIYRVPPAADAATEVGAGVAASSPAAARSR